MSAKSTRALVLPHTSPPDMWRLKYLALLFDHIAIPHPDDQAVVNRFDWEEKVPEKFQVSSVSPAEQLPFLRDADYTERYRATVHSLEPIRHRNVLEILPLRPGSREDTTKLLQFVANAVSSYQLVEAAIPDRTMQAPPFDMPLGFYNPMDISLEWVAPLQAVPKIRSLGNPQSVLNAHGLWSAVAWLRLGCVAKYLRKACLADAVPTSLDEVTSKILLAIASGTGSPVTVPQQHDLALYWGVLNPLKLKDHLENMTWHDVFDLRRELLPVYGRIRNEVQSRIRRFGPTPNSDLQEYRSSIFSLRMEFEQLQEKELESIKSTGIKALFTVGGAIAAAFVLAGSWPLIAAMLGGGALSAPDLQSWYLSSRNKRKHVMHPIFALEQVAHQATLNAAQPSLTSGPS